MTTEEFIKERRILKNVSPKTINWYNQSFKTFQGALDSKSTIIQRIAELRARGVQAVSVNSWLRCVNAYFRWLHLEYGKELIRIPRLKEEQKILATFSSEQVKRIVSYKPQTRNLTRAHMVACLLFDTGLRISEALFLRKQEVDFDNLCIKVHGKGGKQRLVPMSLELRRVLYRWTGKQNADFIFATRTGIKLTVRNFERDFKELCRRLAITGVRCSPHTCRHSFACEYLRRGGNLEFLRRILGHSSILTTQQYLRSLGVEDLKAVHNGLSLLSR